MRLPSYLLLAIALSGCAGPRPPMPPAALVAAPSDWRIEGSPLRGIDRDWWVQFGDPALDELVERALAQNVDLMAAGAKISEARAQFRLSESHGQPSAGLSIGGGPTRTISAFGEGVDQTQSSAQLSVSYEVDLFGRLSAATDASRQTLIATEFERDATRVALISTVVTGYVGLRSLDMQLQTTIDTVNSRAAELTVLRRRSAAGYSSQLDLLQAEAVFEAAARLVPATRLAITKQESALSVLVGDAPGAIARGADLEGLGPLEIPHMLPAAVLRQRPDIAEAEAHIVAADRNLDSARAAFMPRIQLSANAGGVASTALPSPVSLFSIGSSILAPLFQGGALRASADAAAARRDQAAFAYRKTALTAFQEVEDALAGVVRNGEERETATRQVASLRAALDLARRRYRAGYSSYLDQLDAERSLLEAQLQLIDLHRKRLASVVALYQSLGGGWQRSDRYPQS